MVDRNDTLLREVDEELRREQLEKLWQKYGTYAFIAAALIVVGVGGTKWLEARRIAATEQAGQTFQNALASLEQGKAGDATTALAGIASSGPAGYQQLAKLRLAAEAMKAGKTADALQQYEAVATSGSTDALIRGFAQLQAASLRLGEADFTEMQNRLNDLVKDDGPWRGNARELLGLAAMKAGKTDEARRSFEQLLGERNTPQSVVERVTIYLGSLVAGDLAKPAAPAAAAPAAAVPADAKDGSKPGGGATKP